MMKSGAPEILPEGTKLIVGENVFGIDLKTTIANHFNVMVGPSFVRIVFGEGFGSGNPKETHWHTAIAMPLGDGIELGKMLNQLAADGTKATAPPRPQEPVEGGNV